VRIPSILQEKFRRSLVWMMGDSGDAIR
jgi:hypothetical protein